MECTEIGQLRFCPMDVLFEVMELKKERRIKNFGRSFGWEKS